MPGATEPGRDKDESASRTFGEEGTWSTDTLLLDFWTPELWEIKLLLFQATRFMGFYYNSPWELTHMREDGSLSRSRWQHGRPPVHLWLCQATSHQHCILALKSSGKHWQGMGHGVMARGGKEDGSFKLKETDLPLLARWPWVLLCESVSSSATWEGIEQNLLQGLVWGLYDILCLHPFWLLTKYHRLCVL